MSEVINNSAERKAKLKVLIRRLHDGAAADTVRQELMSTLQKVPYGEVVEVEQQLIAEGLPETEVMKLCDVHHVVLDGNVDQSGAEAVPEGHPIDVFRRENEAILAATVGIRKLLEDLPTVNSEDFPALILKLRKAFGDLADVDKHYRRKEYLLFPLLEKEGITGPPKVMWGKHDEARSLLKGAQELLGHEGLGTDDFRSAMGFVVIPALEQVEQMVAKENQILLPMAYEKLTEVQWFEVEQGSLEFGFCLYDPPVAWKPEGLIGNPEETENTAGRVRLPSGTFSVEELQALLNTLPVDLTFVDKDDKVKFFSQGSERIFQRNRAILGRDVRNCHPPASVHIVDKIIDDFRSGRENRAPFWIKMGPKFVHIEYFALRGTQGEYLGTLEVSHDVAKYRALEGEQRLLAYDQEKDTP